MTDRIRKALGDLKAKQDAGEHMSCPRCGQDTMKESEYPYQCPEQACRHLYLRCMRNGRSPAEVHAQSAADE